MGQSNSCGQGYCFLSVWCHMEGVLWWGRRLLQYGEWLSTGILVAAPSVPSQKPLIKRLFCSISSPLCPTLLEPTVSSYKWNYVCWAFKRLSVTPAISLPGWQKPCHFHSWMLSGLLSQLWCYRLGSQAWGLEPTFLRESPLTTEFPSSTSTATHGSPANPLVSPLHSIPVIWWWTHDISYDKRNEN